MVGRCGGSSPNKEVAMKITSRDRFWMNFKLYQLWRFIVLNLKILKAVDHSKRS
jgi:hypothetical protein